MLAVAVVGGLFRLEGAWLGALVFTVLETYTRGHTERFETWIGVIFLLVVVVSPGGLMGVVSALDARVRRALRPRVAS